MNGSVEPTVGAGRVRRRVIEADRKVAQTAPLRCAAYAAWSEILASPHEVDPRPELERRIGLEAEIPYCVGLDALLGEVRDADLTRLQREYSSLFEVGSQGPPVPIREDLQTGQRGGTREEIVRFYDYFGYRLGERFAWQPDHLSVELEFMHYLCYRESAADDNELSYQLAQLDFLERHLVRWTPTLAAEVGKVASGSLYARVVQGLNLFLEGDLDWQRATVIESPGESRT